MSGTGSSSLRFLEGSDSTNCQACNSAKVSNPKININPDSNINGIHLSIFPPTATYVKETQHAYMSSSKADDIPRSYLNVNVHEKTNQKIIMAPETIEGRRKMSLGYLSHISLKRCDSILHISIGNSSKITKRHKKNSWLFANVWKLLRRGKASSQRKYSFGSSQINFENVHSLSNRSLNLLNDNLIISINKRNYGDCNLCTSSHNFTPGHEGYHKQVEISEDFRERNEIETGANELDCYMNEIKRREMR